MDRKRTWLPKAGWTKWLLAAVLLIVAYLLDQRAAQLTGVSVTVSDPTPTGLTLVVTQDGFSTYERFILVEGYELEYQSPDGWMSVASLQPEEESSFDPEGVELHKGESAKMPVDWSERYGILAAGAYRISKGIVSQNDTRALLRAYSAEFVVDVAE